MMTLFSCLVSERKSNQFKEPVLLSALLGKGRPLQIAGKSHIDGWLVHYAVGFFFAAVYDRIWQTTQLKPTVSSGLMLGGVNGLIAVGIWKAAFTLHPDPPQIPYKKYYGHLLAAHLVFGMFTVLGYKLTDKSATRIEYLKTNFIHLVRRDRESTKRKRLLLPLS
jgi:hypothetical protein